MRARLLCQVVALSTAIAADIPTGTQLTIRLTTPVKVTEAKTSDPVEAVVVAPVVIGNDIVLAAGTKVHGQIKEIKQAPKPEDQASLQIEFGRLEPARGPTALLKARVLGVDNARESVDEQGRILGIVASQTGSGRLDQGIAKVAQRYPGLGDLLGAAKSVMLKEADPNIDYEPGVELTIELTGPLKWIETATQPQVGSISPADALAALVNRQPMRTLAERPPAPSDITNIMLIGSRERLEDAFRKAGWTTAQKLNAESKLETFRALVEGRGYKEAPVSTLLLEYRPPDLVFQKQNNTFAKRHHLRIWRRSGTFNGKEIWICAATHDIGIDLSEREHTFIHRIDSEIDRERAKVVNDLLFTGNVQALALVDRPDAPKNGENATGDAFKTDGRMAVLEF